MTDLTRLLLTLSRPALFALALVLTTGGAQAAQVDYFLKIPGIPGESEATAVPLSGFELQAFGEQPLIGLLLPAVQKVRDAAARPSFAELACEGTSIPELEIEARRRGGGPSAIVVKFTDLVVSSWGLQGGGDGNDLLIVNNGDGSDFAIREHVLLSYTGLEMTDPATGETLEIDCSTGRCECIPGR